MARFYFNLHECGAVTEDREGHEMDSLESARDMAVAAARDLMGEELKEGRLCFACHIEIIDEAGQEMMTLPFRSAVTVSGL